jgi:3-oxoadipate enol-lactonase
MDGCGLGSCDASALLFVTMKTHLLNFTLEGQGPYLLLSHALGCDLSMWDGVAEHLRGKYTVVRYDHRGHGRSPTPPEPWTIEMMADDTAALIEAHCDGPVHFAGLSMGGMTAQALASRRPDLVRSITIANSASAYDAAAQAMWAARVETVRLKGVGAIAEVAMQRWFTPAFRADKTHGGAQRVALLRQGLERMSGSAYAAACAAVAAIDFRDRNTRIACPTLVIAGTLDEATPLSASEQIVAQIPGARLRTLEAAHLSAVEQPAQFAQLLDGFLSSL